jgi:hypothetical protein
MDSRYKQIIDNVQLMVNKGAQGKDITGYLAYEGLTPTQFKKLVEGPTFGGYVKEFFKGVPSGAINLAETAAVGASAVLPESFEKPARKFIEETAAGLKKPFVPEIGYEDTIPRKSGEVVGSTLPFFALGPLGTAGRIAGVGTGVAAGAGEARIGAEQAGATDSDRALATVLGAPTGLLDIIAPELKIARGMVANALVRGGVEGATEAAQRISQNLIAKGVYNPEQPILIGSGEEGAYGAGAGALASLLVDLVTGRRGSSVKPSPGAPTTGTPSTATGIPSTATQPDMLGGDTAGYRAAPAGEVYSDLQNIYGQPLPPMEVPSARAAQETEAARQNKLFQITGMREEYDVLERELGRLEEQFNAPTATVEEKQAILERADELNAARAELAAQIKQQSRGLEGTERAGAVEEPGQRELDFDAPAMFRQRTGEGVVLGEEPAAPPGLSPEQIEMFRQERVSGIQARMDAGQMVTPADQAFLRMDEREQRALFEAQPTPELFTPEERPDFRLGPQYLEPSPVEVPSVETRPVTETDFKAMGIGATNKKLREVLLGKDLADPVQREEVKETLTDFANNPNRSERVIAGVSNFLNSPVFMEQGELDLRPARKPRAKKAEEIRDVIEPTEPIEQPSESSPAVVEYRGKEPAAGIETPESTGVGVAGEPSEQPAVGEAVQPTTLAEGKITPQQATSRLIQEGKFTPKEARETVENLTDGYNEVSVADVDEELSRAGKPVTPKEKYTPEQRAMAESIASDFGGPVVWQEGDVALIRAYGKNTGRPVYIGAKGNRYTLNDMEVSTVKFFTPQERASLIAEKKRQEYTDTQKHNTKPYPGFPNQIMVSANTPKELGAILKGWADLLGIKANIYVTTVEDARADKDKFTGPYRAIGSAGRDPNEIGSMRRLPNGDYYIAFTKSTSKTQMLETLAHELGHVHQKEKYNNASPELQNSIKKEFEKWLSSQKGKTARELVDALRAKTTAKQTTVAKGKMADDLSKDYWRSFDEWYADQVSRWATTDEKPISVVEKFFARLGRALRTFFGNLKNKRYLANETFVQYLDKVKDVSSKDTFAPDPGEVKPMLQQAIDTVSANFKKWFKNSVVRNPDGTPKVMYHGTARDIEEFRPKQAGAIFLTDDPRFAESFSEASEYYMVKNKAEFFTPEQMQVFRGQARVNANKNATDYNEELDNVLRENLPSKANIIPVYVSAQNPFDFNNPEHIAALRGLNTINAGDISSIKGGVWRVIEQFNVQEAIKSLGHDGFYVQEGGRKNLAVYDSSQIKSVFNKGSYDPSDSRISYQLKSTETLTPEGERAAALNERMKNIGNEPEPDIEQSYRDRLTMYTGIAKGVPMKFRQSVVDKDAPVKEQLAAKFQNAVTNGLGEIRPDILNEQAQEATGIADQLMRRGGIRKGKDGLMEVYDREEGGEKISLDRVFEIVVEDLGKKLGSAKTAVTLAHRAFIAQRASEINKRNAARQKEAEAAEAKGNLAAAKKLRAQIIRVRASQEEIDTGLEAMRTYPELKQAFDVFTKYNEGITDFLVDTDRLSPAEAQAWKDNIGYVPWTRMEEEDSKIDSLTKIRVGNAHLTSLPTLDKEGSSKEIRNVLDNMVGHTIWAMRSGMKNRAALKTLEALPAVEELKTQDAVDTERKNNPQLVVFAYRNGERVAFKVQNQEDIPAFSDIVDVAGPILGIFKAASTTLRSFVTHMPTFALSQLSQDTVRAMFLSGVKHPFSLPSKVVKNFYKALTNKASDMQALGITGSFDGMPDNAMRKMRERHGLQDRAAFKRGWDKLEEFSLAADMAVRAAIYEQTIQETGDRVLAFHRAKEYINFKTQGNGQAVRILRQIVPFMNAYIQGMDVLYRTIQGKGISGADRKEAIALFLTTGMKVAALSTLYAMLVGDDEDYKGLDDRERDFSYILPGTGLKLPAPPEIALLFKVIPERLYQAAVREGTDRPVDATTFMRGMRDAAINAYGGMNITPQLVKPAIEVATNYSFFTGNPIVGIRMAEAETRFQFNNNTSEVAKLLGYVGVSPMKADHLLRGYFGTVGGVVLDVTDAVADPNRMNKPVNKLPLIKTFMYDDTGRGYKTEFYAFREDVDKVVNSVNILKSQGRIEELQEYLTEDKLKLYAMKGVINKVEETLGKLRQYRNIIANDPDLTPAEKREKTDEILQQEREILKMYNVPQLKQLAGR